MSKNNMSGGPNAGQSKSPMIPLNTSENNEIPL